MKRALRFYQRNQLIGAIALSSITPLSWAEALASPQAVIKEMQRLQQSDCGLTCHLALADLYTVRFLNAQRDVVLAALEPQETRAAMTQSFFGRQIDLIALKKMSPQEFFAHQTYYRVDTVPSEFLLSDITIISSSEDAADKVSVTVELSGMTADPDYKEESLFHFVKTEDGWKIDAQF